MRVVFPAGFGDPGANRILTGVIAMFVVDRRIGRKAIGGCRDIEPVGRFDVSRHHVGQSHCGCFHGWRWNAHTIFEPPAAAQCHVF